MNSEPYARAFILASVGWLVLGLLVLITVLTGPLHEIIENLPELGAALEDKIHVVFYIVQLYGFVVMMICGVSYHILPRFFSRPDLVESGYANAWWHFGLMNLGILAFAAGALLKVTGLGEVFGLISYGGVLALALALALYAYNVARTIW